METLREYEPHRQRIAVFQLLRELLLTWTSRPGGKRECRTAGEVVEAVNRLNGHEIDDEAVYEALAVLERLGVIEQHLPDVVQLRDVDQHEAREVLGLESEILLRRLRKQDAQGLARIQPLAQRAQVDAEKASSSGLNAKFALADAAFHATIAGIEHPRDRTVVESYRDCMHLYRTSCRPVDELFSPAERADILREHERVLEALAARDVRAVVAAVEAHLAEDRGRLLESRRSILARFRGEESGRALIGPRVFLSKALRPRENP
jgi:DNA-binding GntR family transcriptional regulator